MSLQGSADWGITVSASLNHSTGKEKGNGVSQNETTLDAGHQLTLTSGRDTTLAGAQVSGEKVVADVGRDLTLSSLQDSNNYDSRQTSVSAGGSFTFGSMTGSAYLSASRDKMKSNYDSVIEQTGIYAGKEGFDITTGGHTQLNGAVIASTADSSLNKLDTGTLGFSDIGNRADYKVEHLSGSFSTGGAVGSQVLGNMASSLLSGLGASGHAEGVTRAAVSDGTLIVRDQAAQKQDVSTLSHDTAGANGSISPIFDKEKEQKRLQIAQLVGEVATQAMDVARTEGDIRATIAGKAQLAKENIHEPAADEGRDAWDKYNNQVQNSSDYRDTQAEWGTGSDIQRGIQAATAAVQGLLAGSVQGAAAGAAAPYLAGLIHKETTSVNGNSQEVNKPANLIAHAVLGAVVAQLQGNNALAGAAGATTGEFIAQQLYPGVEHGKLSEEQKQKISALSTLAAGLAGSLASGNMSGTVAAASAGKNAVENNHLNSTQGLTFDKELSDCRKTGGDCQAVIDKWKKVSDKQSAEVDQKLKDNPLEVQVVDKEIAQGGYDMAQRPGWLGSFGADVMTSEEAKAYVQQWNGKDLANIDVNSPEWVKYAAFASDPENQAALASLGKDLFKLAKATVSNIAQGGVSTSIKSMQTGLRNPQQVDQIKNDMTSGNYRFNAPEGRIAGYIDSKGNYYISEGNHRMVAAQEIYKKTGDKSYIDKLLQNGSWTQTKNAPAGAKSMPTRK